MLKSGVHAAIAGVLLAFAILFSAKQDDAESPSHRLEYMLHKPVAFIILPIFALANTGFIIGSDWAQELTSPNSLGILAGLVMGKPVRITLLCFITVASGICRLPFNLERRHLLDASLLGGIGFTISIFITNLAFTGQVEVINASKIIILSTSLLAGSIGFIWLKIFGKPLVPKTDIGTTEFEESTAPSSETRAKDHPSGFSKSVLDFSA